MHLKGLIVGIDGLGCKASFVTVWNTLNE
jgi:predicted transposase YbfD/YdcC